VVPEWRRFAEQRSGQQNKMHSMDDVHALFCEGSRPQLIAQVDHDIGQGERS
jgi:hypothetical protein